MAEVVEYDELLDAESAAAGGQAIVGVAEDELTTYSWPIVDTTGSTCKAKNVSMDLNAVGYKAVIIFIGEDAGFSQQNKTGHVLVSTGFGNSNAKNANDVFGIGVAAMFPDMKVQVKKLEVEHKKNSALKVSKEQRFANQAKYSFDAISFYTWEFNMAVKGVGNRKKTPTAGVSLKGYQAQYTLNWLEGSKEKRIVTHPLECLQPFRKLRANNKPRRTLEYVHKERIDSIHKYHFSEARMKKYRGSLHFVKRNGVYTLEEMTDDDIKQVFRQRYKVPTAEEIEAQRKEFIEITKNKAKKKRKGKKKNKKKIQKKAKCAKYEFIAKMKI